MKWKKVPSYWWDFEGEDEVIIESDHLKYPIVARFKYDPINGGVPADKYAKMLMPNAKRMGQAKEAIKQAEKVIEDLEAGRISLKNLIKKE